MIIDAVQGDVEIIPPLEEEMIEKTSETKARDLARECFASFEAFLADQPVQTMKSGRAQAISEFIAAQNNMAERFIELQSPKIRAELESYSRAKMLATATKLMIFKGGMLRINVPRIKEIDNSGYRLLLSDGTDWNFSWYQAWTTWHWEVGDKVLLTSEGHMLNLNSITSAVVNPS